MTAADLVTKWKAKVGVPSTPEGQAIQDTQFLSLAEGIIEEITTMALVTVTVASVSGVIPGGGVSGPGAGTGTVA